MCGPFFVYANVVPLTCLNIVCQFSSRTLVNRQSSAVFSLHIRVHTINRMFVCLDDI